MSAIRISAQKIVVFTVAILLVLIFSYMQHLIDRWSLGSDGESIANDKHHSATSALEEERVIVPLSRGYEGLLGSDQPSQLTYTDDEATTQFARLKKNTPQHEYEQDFIFAEILKISRAIQKRHGFVTVQFLNAGYINITKSWICNVRCMDVLSQIIFVTTDTFAFEELTRWDPNIHVLLMQYDTQTDLSFGQVGYFRFMLFRTRVILELLQSGMSVFLCEADAVWLRNPVPFMLAHTGFDVLVAPNDYDKPNGELAAGFVYLNATAHTIDSWREVLTKFRANLIKYSDDSQIIGWDNTDITLLNTAIKDGQLLVQILPDDKFVCGKWYKEERIRNATTPVVIQNNYIIGNKSKIKRAMAWGHWYLSDSGNCSETRCTR